MQNSIPIEERLARLRDLMIKNSLNALIVTSRDEFLNEYVDKQTNQRTFISGFDGTAGEVLVTLDEAYLIVDGRYHTQADNQVDKTLYNIEKVGIDETGKRINELVLDRLIKLIEKLSKGKNLIIGYDPGQFSVKTINYLREQTQKVSSTTTLTPLYKNLVIEISGETLPQQLKSVYYVPEGISGKTPAQKLDLIREQLVNKNLNSLFISKLDELAYISNLRCNELEYNSTCKGYAFITTKDAFIFTNVERFGCKDLTKIFEAFEVLPLTDMDECLRNYINSVIGYLPGRNNSDKYLFIMAHYDHLGKKGNNRIYSGADDNASGVAALLELARVISKTQPDKNIVFVATSGEEMGTLGSTYLGKQLNAKGFKDKVEVLNIDCLAAEGDFMTIEGGGPKMNKHLQKSAMGMADQLGIAYETPARNDRTDAHAMEKAGFPAISFLWAWMNDCSNRPHYHDPTDKPDIANYDNLKKSADLIMATAWDLSKDVA